MAMIYQECHDFLFVPKSMVCVMHDTRSNNIQPFKSQDRSELECAFILYKGHITTWNIVQYIETTFIYLPGMDNRWHTKLISRLKHMKYDERQNKLSFYMNESSRSKRIVLCDYNTVIENECLTMQLNEKHASLYQMNLFLNAKQVFVHGLTRWAKYNVVVYSHEQCPYPFLDHLMEPEPDSVEFEYQRRFRIAQFVEDALLHLNAETMDEEMVYVVATVNKYNRLKFHRVNEMFVNYEKCVEFYIFQIHTRSKDPNKKKVTIRFGEWETEPLIFKYYGFPLIVWIDRADTLQHIIDKYVSQRLIEDIEHVYRVKDTEIKLIRQSKWKARLWKKQQDMILIKLKSQLTSFSWDDVLHVPQWISEKCQL
eukprot:376786_1